MNSYNVFNAIFRFYDHMPPAQLSLMNSLFFRCADMSHPSTLMSPVANSFRLQLNPGLVQLFALGFVLPEEGGQLAALVLVPPLQRRHLLLAPADLLLLTPQLSLSVQGLQRQREQIAQQPVSSV